MGKIIRSCQLQKTISELVKSDTGLNTGGMGAISPVPFADKDLLAKIEDRIVKPTILGLQKDNLPYKGFILLD